MTNKDERTQTKDTKSSNRGHFTVSDDKCDHDYYIKPVNYKGLIRQSIHPRKGINRNPVHVVTLSQSWEVAYA